MHELISLLFSFFFFLFFSTFSFTVPSTILPTGTYLLVGTIPFAVLFPSLCKKEYPHSKYRCDFDYF